MAAGLEDWVDFGVICALLLLNAGVGFVQEYQAGSIVDELKKTLALKAVVLRDGTLKEIEAPEVVPGDILQVEEVSSNNSQYPRCRFVVLVAPSAPPKLPAGPTAPNTNRHGAIAHMPVCATQLLLSAHPVTWQIIPCVSRLALGDWHLVGGPIGGGRWSDTSLQI